MSETAPSPEKKPVLWTNLITLTGLLFVAAGILLLVTFWLFVAVSPTAENNQYLCAVGFMILPGILINGLIMCPVGMFIKKWRLKHGPIKQISARNAFIFLGVTFFLILPVLGVSGYKGYHFTESAEFCGTICHNMDPQYVRYEQSPHARVTCAGCHIGPGASPFVKSKLSGLRQVFKTALNTYPRPVPPAITELRPARDTCEQCHWPQHFFGSKLKRIARFAPDETNTRHDYEILIKVGGANVHSGQAEGIHMHMLDAIEYVSEDHRLDHIPWVRYKYPDGRKVVFRSDGKQGSEPPSAHGAVRRLDCIDCHNLIGHDFPSPERAVDHALFVKRLDASLPYIKRESVMVLAQTYKTREEGLAAIEKGLQGFYRSNYPQVLEKNRAGVDQAVKAVGNIYRDATFPDMKVDWRTYPNHIGHMESPGCFRCHDGLHVADDGKRISSDCTVCHTFQYRQPGAPNTIIEKKFDHPMKIHEAWTGLGPHENMLCTDCHDGGLSAVGWKVEATGYTCGDCHPSGRWLEIQKNLRIRAAAATTRPTTMPTGPVHGAH